MVGALWLVALAYYLTRPYLNHDVSWVLVATERMLDGARLYLDIIEVNPPLIFYSVVPPVAVARLTGWPAESIFVLYVLLLAVLSLVLTAHLLARTEVTPPHHRPYLLLAGFVALIALPISDFGQREHFTAILTLPYVVLAAARIVERDCSARLAIIAGLMAGIGFAFKPYFCVVPAALALYLVIRRRSLRAAFPLEAISAAMVIGLYAAVIFVAHPDYIDVIVPYGRLVYDAYTRPVWEILLLPAPMLLPFGIYVLARVSGHAGRSLDAFAIAAGGFFVAYVVQSKGWTYHLIPASAFTWMCAAASAIALAEATGVPRRPRILCFCMALVVLAGMVANPLMRGVYHNEFADRLTPIIRSLAPSGSLYAFTSHVSVAFPLVVESGLGWASSFPTQWLLPGIANQLREPDALEPSILARLEEVRRYNTGAVIGDLARTRPEIILVDLDNSYFAGPPFDYLAFFGRDPRFQALWRDYVRVRQVTVECGQTRRLDIYCRRGTTPACAQ